MSTLIQMLDPKGELDDKARALAPLLKSVQGTVGGFRVHFTDERVGSKLVELSLIDSQGRVRE